MGFKVGDRVKVTRLNRQNVNFFATLKYVIGSNDMYRLVDCSNPNFTNTLVWKDYINNLFGKDKEDYYVLAEDEEPTLRWSDGSSADGEIYKEEEVQFSEETWGQAGKNLRSFENALNNDSNIEQRTELSDKGVIIAHSIISNRDGASFLSNHEMIMWLKEIEEMHGESISVKGWHLILDHVKDNLKGVGG